ncbi:MAG TPA: hypothetical protein VGK84_02455 [Candidatus Tumulicola sp.]|jgi:hypothetical protein
MIRRTVAIATIALVAGCGGGQAAAPSGGAVTPGLNVAPAASQSTIPGQYIGRATDTKFRHGKLRADLSQAGKAVGGDFKFKFKKPVNGSVALGVAKNDLAGVMTATIGSQACTFTMSATYDPQAYTLDGSYAAKNGCSAESGTFTLEEQCYYIDGFRSHSPEAVRPAAGGLKPC